VQPASLKLSPFAWNTLFLPKQVKRRNININIGSFILIGFGTDLTGGTAMIQDMLIPFKMGEFGMPKKL